MPEGSADTQKSRTQDFERKIFANGKGTISPEEYLRKKGRNPVEIKMANTALSNMLRSPEGYDYVFRAGLNKLSLRNDASYQGGKRLLADILWYVEFGKDVPTRWDETLVYQSDLQEAKMSGIQLPAELIDAGVYHFSPNAAVSTGKMQTLSERQLGFLIARPDLQTEEIAQVLSAQKSFGVDNELIDKARRYSDRIKDMSKMIDTRIPELSLEEKAKMIARHALNEVQIGIEDTKYKLDETTRPARVAVSEKLTEARSHASRLTDQVRQRLKQ